MKRMNEVNNHFIADVRQRSGLLPCPFCGENPHKGGNGNGQHVAKCYNCGVVMAHDRADKLEVMWNRRQQVNCG